MNFNFFRKPKFTGWEIGRLIDSLTEANKGESGELIEYAQKNPLCAINETKDRFVVIRQFLCHPRDGEIGMLNAEPEEDDDRHWGMTLVIRKPDAGIEHSAYLPDKLRYKSVQLSGETIRITTSEKEVTTNFGEINKLELWPLHNIPEAEIEKLFNSLENKIEVRPVVNKLKDKSLTVPFFGTLTHNSQLDWYECELNLQGKKVTVSFDNAEKEKFDKNLETTQQVLKSLDTFEKRMVKETLTDKNDNWREEGEAEWSEAEFAKQLELYAITVHEPGSLSIYYKAGDLFWGHEVQISIEADGSYRDSDLVG